MGLCRLSDSSQIRRIGKGPSPRPPGSSGISWGGLGFHTIILTRSFVLHPTDILAVPYEQWGASLIYFTGESRSGLRPEP